MGLDMYLSKKTYVKQWAHNEKKDQFSVSIKKVVRNTQGLNQNVCLTSPKKLLIGERQIKFTDGS